jgi:hypothetical protein
MVSPKHYCCTIWTDAREFAFSVLLMLQHQGSHSENHAASLPRVSITFELYQNFAYQLIKPHYMKMFSTFGFSISKTWLKFFKMNSCLLL